MTKGQIVQAVQAHFNDWTPAFKERVEAVLPSAIARFMAEAQWEFLDKYTTCTSSVSTDAASGKYKIDTPDDFFKPIVIFTTNREIEYRDRLEWAKMQSFNVSGTLIPQYYTVIGPELVLTHTPDSATIQLIYTRRGDDYTLPDLPGQYHWAVQCAMQLLLTPAYFEMEGRMIPNPAFSQGQMLYEDAVRKAKKFEVTIKGRVRELLPTEINRRRAAYE